MNRKLGKKPSLDKKRVAEKPRQNKNRQSRVSTTYKQQTETEEQNLGTQYNPESSVSEPQSGKAKIRISTAAKVKISLILGGIALIAFGVLFVIVFFTSIFGGTNISSMEAALSLPIGEYYEPECQTAQVIPSRDSNGNPTTGGTYDLETYVEGVVNAEVGQFDNLEVYKAFAIAARTYFLKNHNNCSMRNDTGNQRFIENGSDKIKQAVRETAGQVLLDDNDNLINTQYDAFCSTEVTNDYYTIKQKNQKIPREWADSQQGIKDEWKLGEEIECHGNGASQWGSYYLVQKEGFTYSTILLYYYMSDDNIIKLSSPQIQTDVDGLRIKTTKNAGNILAKPINTYLSENGSSLDTYNNYIRQNVMSVGSGTRKGVVIAALSMINYLYDNYNLKLPNYYNSNTQTTGVPSIIGEPIVSDLSPEGHRYGYVSFDDGGLVSWAIKNGGYNFNKLTPSEIYNRFLGESCKISDETCSGIAGDLLVSPSHVMLIVYYDNSNKTYYVAEATEDGIIVDTRNKYEEKVGANDGILIKMNSFYNNSSNINPNY